MPCRLPIDPAFGVAAMVEARLLLAAADRIESATDQRRTRRTQPADFARPGLAVIEYARLFRQLSALDPARRKDQVTVLVALIAFRRRCVVSDDDRHAPALVHCFGVGDE